MVTDFGIESEGLLSPLPHHNITILRCDVIICNVLMSSLCPHLLKCGIHHISSLTGMQKTQHAKVKISH